MTSTEAKAHYPPWVSVWTSPRETIRDIVDDGRSYGVIPLASLWGISSALSLSSIISLGSELPVVRVLAICLIGGPVVGNATVYLSGGILALLGRVFGGKGRAPEVRVALAWSMVPLALGLVRWGVWIAIFGESTFEFGVFGSSLTFPQSVVYTITSILSWGLGIWSVAILVIGYAEVNEFSVARGVASLVIGGAVVSFSFGATVAICLPLILFALVVVWMLIVSSFGAS